MKIKKEEVIALLIIASLFLFCNFSLFNEGCYEPDVMRQENRGDLALKKGVSAVYLERTIDHPPLYVYVLKFNSWLNFSLFKNMDVLTPHYIFVSKLIPTLCNLAIGLSIFFYLRKTGSKTAILAMLLYLFNPAIIYNTAYWGKEDSVNALLMLLSIIFLTQKKYIFSTIFISLAILTKIQNAILLPVVGLIVLKNCDYKKIVGIIFLNLLLTGVILSPYLLSGAISEMVSAIWFSLEEYPVVTVNAYNLWFLISPVSPEWRDTLGDNNTFLGLTFKQIGLLLLGAYTLLVLHQLSKNKNEENIIMAAASMALAFFILPTRIHERYLFPFFALFTLITLNKKRFLGAYTLLSTTYLLNLMMILPFKGDNPIFHSIQSALNTLINALSYTGSAYAIALINVFVFIYLNKISTLNNQV